MAPASSSVSGLFHLSTLFISALLGLCLMHGANAQKAVGGQTFTEGLAIVDSPPLGASFEIGTTMELAVDVSGNGRIPVNPDVSASTRLTFLEVYLVSSQTETNLTVVKGSDFLAGEEASSVKHAEFSIPSCAAPGAYDLTVYEGSVINGTEFFSITPIPVRITKSRPGVQPCTTLFNNIKSLPQASSPPPTQPWLGDPQSESTSADPTDSTTSVAGGVTTVSSGEGDETVTMTVDGQTTTLTVSAKPFTTTAVISVVQTQTVTSTKDGSTELLTTTLSSVSTSTVVINGTASRDGFFAANSAFHFSPHALGIMIASVFTVLCLLDM